MATKTLRDLFFDQLQDAYSAETQLTKALPKMAKAASSPDLKAGFEKHLKETEGQLPASTGCAPRSGTRPGRTPARRCRG